MTTLGRFVDIFGDHARDPELEDNTNDDTKTHEPGTKGEMTRQEAMKLRSGDRVSKYTINREMLEWLNMWGGNQKFITLLAWMKAAHVRLSDIS